MAIRGPASSRTTARRIWLFQAADYGAIQRSADEAHPFGPARVRGIIASTVQLFQCASEVAWRKIQSVAGGGAVQRRRFHVVVQWLAATDRNERPMVHH